MAGKALELYVYNTDGKDLKEALDRAVMDKVEKASVAAMEDFSKIVLRAGRSAIAQGGGKFTTSNRFRNAMKVKVYENKKVDAAIFLYHKAPYAGIFETGGTISGRPFLWLPTDVVADGVRTPKQFRRYYPTKKLRTARRKGKPPMLVADIGFGKKRGGYGSKSVPVFVGVPLVDIPKKFAVEQVVQSVMGRFEPIYRRKLRQYD